MGMKIAVIGYGVEGKALAQYFSKRGNQVTVCDARQQEDFDKKYNAHFGPEYLKGLENFDLIFRSPGVPVLRKEFENVRHKLTSLTKYFFEKCPCPIIGVTGTKGKGTTCALIHEILKQTFIGAGHRRVFLGGNIGNAPLEFLDELKKDDMVVLELSSFQLQDAERGPHIAVVLGITPDHLDYHKNFEEYIAAKLNLVKFQKPTDFAVLDFDNKESQEFKNHTQAKIYGFSVEDSVEEGAFLKVGSFVLKKGKTGTIFGEKGRTKLAGDHNIKNIFAAATAANLAGAPVEIVEKVIREFAGLPHRLERVGEFGGVEFYNDSASTNAQTTIAAIRAFNKPIILILGGSDKNCSFAPLAEEIAAKINVEKVILMGETKKKIEEAIDVAYTQNEAKTQKALASGLPAKKREIPLEVISAESFHEAFMVARLIAEPGSVVLLSPACASFDMFSNYKERGEIFRNFVLDFQKE